MGGGMRRGQGPTLAERVATAVGEAASVPDLPPAPERLRGGPRHCWVQDPPEAAGTWPGLLLAWSRAAGGPWQGRVVYVHSGANGLVLVEAWLDARHLSEG